MSLDGCSEPACPLVQDGRLAQLKAGTAAGRSVLPPNPQEKKSLQRAGRAQLSLNRALTKQLLTA